jgi:hypothetical protein
MLEVWNGDLYVPNIVKIARRTGISNYATHLVQVIDLHVVYAETRNQLAQAGITRRIANGNLSNRGIIDLAHGRHSGTPPRDLVKAIQNVEHPTRFDHSKQDNEKHQSHYRYLD